MGYILKYFCCFDYSKVAAILVVIILSFLRTIKEGVNSAAIIDSDVLNRGQYESWH